MSPSLWKSAMVATAIIILPTAICAAPVNYTGDLLVDMGTVGIGQSGTITETGTFPLGIFPAPTYEVSVKLPADSFMTMSVNFPLGSIASVGGGINVSSAMENGQCFMVSNMCFPVMDWSGQSLGSPAVGSNAQDPLMKTSVSLSSNATGQVSGIFSFENMHDYSVYGSTETLIQTNGEPIVTSYRVSAVPLPASGLLFGGIIALGGLYARRRAA